TWVDGSSAWRRVYTDSRRDPAPRPEGRDLGTAAISGEREARECVFDQPLAPGQPRLRQLADDLGGGEHQLGATGRPNRARCGVVVGLVALGRNGIELRHRPLLPSGA